MIRCPHCRHPNPDRGGPCARCGGALPAPPPPPAPWREELAARVWARPAWAAAGLLLFRALAQPFIATRSGMDLNHFYFHLLQGLLLGAGAAWCRKQRGFFLPAWGLVGAAFSYAADYALTWRFKGFELVWRILYFFSEGQGAQSGRATYAVLQAARILPLALVLWGAVVWVDRRPRAALVGFVGAFFGTALHALVVGGQFTLQKMQPWPFFAYFSSIFVILWGLSATGGMDRWAQHKP